MPAVDKAAATSDEVGQARSLDVAVSHAATGASSAAPRTLRTKAVNALDR